MLSEANAELYHQFHQVLLDQNEEVRHHLNAQSIEDYPLNHLAILDEEFPILLHRLHEANIMPHHPVHHLESTSTNTSTNYYNKSVLFCSFSWVFVSVMMAICAFC